MEFRVLEFGSEDYALTVDLRRRVLRIPLGLDFTPEQIEAENEDLHLAAFEHGRLVACLVLTPVSKLEVKMRQVAVEPEMQGVGIGKALVVFSEAEARSRGFRLMSMSARDTAIPFYERLGYSAVGEPFTEVGIPHRRMEKAI